MKPGQFISSCLIACAAIMAILLPSTVSAKQCVWNKGGYVLDVRWYRPADLRLFKPDGHMVDASHLNDIMSVEARQPPVQVDRFPIAQGRCTNTNEVLTAVISVVGGYPGSCPTCDSRPRLESALVYGDFTYIYSQGHPGPVAPGTWHPSISTGVYGVLNTSGTPRMPNGEALRVNAARVARALVPDAQVILIATPPTTHYLDFWGTVFRAEWGQGGPITN